MSFDGWYHQCANLDQESAVYYGESCKWCGLNESQYRLTRYTDDQLRAECERRGFPAMRDWLWAGMDRLGLGGVFTDKQWADRVDGLLSAERERDEWRRRAETAEYERRAETAEYERDLYRKSGEARGRDSILERGPGIAATKPDTSLDIDPLDLLADDA